MTELDRKVAELVAADKAAVESVARTVVYPRFLGIDGSGDYVWELANGRWTWGDDPHGAATKERTFEPERYCEKYGAPEPKAPFFGSAPTSRPPFPGPASQPARIDTGGPLGDAGTRGAARALGRLLEVLEGYIEGAKENHEAMGHRGENTGSECWTTWHREDIQSMVNDAAREVGLPIGTILTGQKEGIR
jgi:hypothetical protein